MVPKELRAAYRLMKNAGYLPPQVAIRNEVASVDTLLVQARTREESNQLKQRRRYLLMQLGVSNPQAALLNESFYLDKLKQR